MILLLILIVCHLTIGSVYIPFSDVISFFLQKQSLSTDYAQLIMLTRLSTLITAILAGIGLSLSGSILQSILAINLVFTGNLSDALFMAFLATSSDKPPNSNIILPGFITAA